jgi:hypothetical protein
MWKFNLNTGYKLLDIVSTAFFSILLVFIGFIIGHSFHYEEKIPNSKTGPKDTLVFQVQPIVMDTIVVNPIRVIPIETKTIRLEMDSLRVKVEAGDSLNCHIK